MASQQVEVKKLQLRYEIHNVLYYEYHNSKKISFDIFLEHVRALLKPLSHEDKLIAHSYDSVWYMSDQLIIQTTIFLIICAAIIHYLSNRFKKP
jgi:hypothetical protein